MSFHQCLRRYNRACMNCVKIAPAVSGTLAPPQQVGLHPAGESRR